MKYTILTFLTATAFGPRNMMVQGEGNNVLNNFIKSAMLHFMEFKADDPYVFTGNRRLQLNNPLFQLCGNLTNITYEGVSAIATDEIRSGSSIVYGYFAAMLPFLNSKLSGKHNLSGSVLDALPINGSGDWTLSSNAGDFYIEMDFETENGYVNITDIYARWNLGYTPVVKFHGLLQEEMDEDIVEEVITYLGNEVRHATTMEVTDALLDSVLAFFQNVFQKISLLDIVNKTITCRLPGKAQSKHEFPSKPIRRRFKSQHEHLLSKKWFKPQRKHPVM